MKPAPATTPLVERKYLIPFILITSLFALWGFANDITNPMVAAFQTVMEISAAKASLIQFAFYGGYFTMAIPAALFIRRYPYALVHDSGNQGLLPQRARHGSLHDAV